MQFDGNLLLQVGPISDDCRSVQLEFPETYTRKVAPPAASFETVTMNQLLKDCPPLENGEDHEVHSASLLVAHKRFELVEKKTMNRDREIVFHQLYHEKLERERISQTQRYKQEVLGAPKVLPKLPVSIESLESGTRIKAKFVETVAPLPVADSSNSLFAPSAADKNMIRSTVANPTIDTQAVEISGQSIDSVKEDNNAGTVKISGVDKGLITPRNIIKIRLLKPPTNQMVEKKTVDRRKSAGSARPVGRPRKQPILQNPVVIVPKLLQTPEIKRVAARQKLAYIPESIPIVAGQRRKSDRVSFAFGHPIAPIDRFDMDYNNAIYDIFQLIKKRE